MPTQEMNLPVKPLSHVEQSLLLKRQHGFTSLASCLKSLSQPLRFDRVPDLDAARAAVEIQALQILRSLPPSQEVLTACIKAPSLALLETPFEGPQRADWEVIMAVIIETCADEDTRPSYFLPFEYASVEHLLTFERLGLDPGIWWFDLMRRYLTENDDGLDAMVRRKVRSAPLEDLVVSAILLMKRPFMEVRPGHGCRHLRATEAHVRRGHPALTAHLKANARAFIRNGHWRDLALLLRIGVDLSGLDGKQVEPRLAHLLALSGSAHGQIELARMEPDLVAMSGRDETSGAFFGAARRAFLT